MKSKKIRTSRSRIRKTRKIRRSKRSIIRKTRKIRRSKSSMIRKTRSIRRSKRSMIRKTRRKRVKTLRSRKSIKTNKTSDCRVNIILDIDETLGHNIKKSLWDKVPESHKKKYDYLPFGKNIFVIRPHIKKFVKFLFDNFNVSIWTLGSRSYALWVAHNILIDGNQNRHVKNVMWSTHDSFGRGISEEGYGKDLKYLWIDSEYDDNIDPNNEEDDYYDKYEDMKDHPFLMHNYYPCNTILIDDNEGNATNDRNHFNSIHINGFSLFGHRKNKPYRPQYKDRTLLDMIPVLQKVKTAMDSNTCSDKYFATCLNPNKGRGGRIFDSELFSSQYQRHGRSALHVHVGPYEKY